MTKNLKKRTRLLAIASNSTRARIFCLMFEHGEACVSDIADGLNMSVASVSHHLQIMKDNNLFETKRIGNNICYIMLESDFTKHLRKLLCE